MRNSSFQLRNYISNVWFGYGWQRPSSGQWDIRRSHQLEHPGKLFKGEQIWLVCALCSLPFTFSVPRRILEVQQQLCHHEAISMRRKAGQPKRIVKEKVRKILRSDDVMLPPCPGLPSFRDWRKRDLYLITQLWLEFSVVYSCNYCWFIYHVSMNVTMNNKKKKKLYIFNCIFQIFYGSNA